MSDPTSLCHSRPSCQGHQQLDHLRPERLTMLTDQLPSIDQDHWVLQWFLITARNLNMQKNINPAELQIILSILISHILIHSCYCQENVSSTTGICYSLILLIVTYLDIDYARLAGACECYGIHQKYFPLGDNHGRNACSSTTCILPCLHERLHSKNVRKSVVFSTQMILTAACTYLQITKESSVMPLPAAP